MCQDHSKNCTCGKSYASFLLKDELLPFEAIAGLYCPTCSKNIIFDAETMIKDKDWIIEYNMDVARFMLSKVASASAVTPDFVFDEGYCTWRGVYPGDHIDSARERNELVELAKTDRKRYFEEIKTWGIRRMERLSLEGWRKASERETVKA